MTRYVYLRNELQNEIRKIASELNLLMVKNISDIPGAILHQESTFPLSSKLFFKTIHMSISRC